MLYVALLSLSVCQYYYSVRIFPGQEPASVWVGWVTSDFHQYDPAFELSKVRTVTVTLGDEKGKVHERSVMLLQEHSVILFAVTQLQTQRANERNRIKMVVCIVAVSDVFVVLCSIKRSNCYMVWGGECSSPSQGRNNNGLEIGCLVDTANGLLSFTSNGKELSTYYQVRALKIL